MKPEYWDRIANFIVDFAKDRKKLIDSKDSEIHTIKQEKENEINTLRQEKQNEISSLNNLLNFTKEFGTAKARIHSHLAYKLGQVMIKNSKSIFSYTKLPFLLLCVTLAHRQSKLANKINFPPLESYPDYEAALKEKQCLTYKLGEALIENMKRGGGIEVSKIYERCA